MAKEQKAKKLANAIIAFAKACLDPALEELYLIFTMIVHRTRVWDRATSSDPTDLALFTCHYRG